MMSALTKMSFKLLGFLKAKTGGSLKILHSSGCFCMVVQCSRTMLDKLLSAGWYVMTNGTLLCQALRIKRICSNEQTTKKRLGELKCHPKKRGYNNASINHCFNKASGIDRKDLIQYKENSVGTGTDVYLSVCCICQLT
jgi:hypothetical protein